MQTEQWVLQLLDQVSGNALKMSGALGNLDSQQIKAAQSALAMNRAQAAIGKAQAGVAKNPNDPAAQQKLMEARLRAAAMAARQRDAAAKAAADPNKLIGKKAAMKDVLGGELGNIANAASAAGGPLGAVAQQVQSIAGILGRVHPAVGALILGFVAFTAVITGTTIALYKMGAAALEVIAQRNQLLATFGALSGGGAGGGKTLAIVEKLGTVLPFATAKIAQWGTELQKAGFQGKALEAAIKAVGAAQALMGDSGAQAAQSLLSTLALGGAQAMQLIATLKRGGPEARSQLAEMGLRVEDVARALNMTTAQFKNARLSAKQMAEAIEKALARKAAGPFADLMLTFPVLIQRVREGFLSLFDKLGPAVRPFMKAVKQLFDQFSKGGGAINALKPIVTAVMTTIFGWATKAVGAVSAIVSWFIKATKAGGMLSGVVGVAKGLFVMFGVAIKMMAVPIMVVVALFRKLFSNATTLQGLKTIFTLVAVAIGVVVVAVGAVVTAFGMIISLAASVVGALAGLIGSFYAAGAGLIDGLVNGLTGGAGGLIGAITGMASQALAAFKGVFGIASPSKVMLEQGEKNIAGAAATGVDKGADKMDASMEKLGPKDMKSGGGKGKKGGGGDVFNFHDCNFGDRDEVWYRDMFAKIMSELRGEAATPEPA